MPHRDGARGRRIERSRSKHRRRLRHAVVITDEVVAALARMAPASPTAARLRPRRVHKVYRQHS